MSARQGLNSSRRWTSAVSGIEEASSSNASVCRLVHRHESCIAATQRFSLQSEISKNFSGNLEPMTELYFAARRCKQDLLHILYCMRKAEHIPSMVDTVCSSRSSW
jgi:hypothetical protein